MNQPLGGHPDTGPGPAVPAKLCTWPVSSKSLVCPSQHLVSTQHSCLPPPTCRCATFTNRKSGTGLSPSHPASSPGSSPVTPGHGGRLRSRMGQEQSGPSKSSLPTCPATPPETRKGRTRRPGNLGQHSPGSLSSGTHGSDCPDTNRHRLHPKSPLLHLQFSSHSRNFRSPCTRWVCRR